MSGICRLCLSVSLPVTYKLSKECSILKKICICLCKELSLDNNLPNEICESCKNKINDYYDYHVTANKNQDLLSYHIQNGNDALNKFYSTLKCNIKVKEEINDKSVLVEEENETFNDSTFHTFDNAISKEDSKHKNNVKEEIIDTNDTVSLIYTSEDDTTLSTIKQEREKESLRKYTKQRTLKVKKKGILKINNDISDVNTDDYNNVFQMKHKCLTCYVMFKTQGELSVHYKNRHSEIRDSDEQTLKDYSDVHIDGIMKYKCGKCSKLYENETLIKRHMISHMEHRPYLCNLCGRTYKLICDIIRHGKVHNGYKMPCSYRCGYSTAYFSALREHEMRHRNEYKHVCQECGKGFQTKTWHDQHQNVHKGIKPFICDLCGMAFHMDRYLTTHRSTVHPQSSRVKRYICKHCSLPCDSRTTLTRHFKEHNIKTSFLCDICGKTLADAEKLRYHRKIHLGVKSFICSTCNKSFTKKFNLDIHVQTHMGVKSHVCAHCSKRYTQKSTLNRHIKSHHSDLGSSPYKCIKCEKSFSIRKQFMTHGKTCV